MNDCEVFWIVSIKEMGKYGPGVKGWNYTYEGQGYTPEEALEDLRSSIRKVNQPAEKFLKHIDQMRVWA